MQQKTVKVGNIKIGENHPIAFITGPCQLENRDHAIHATVPANQTEIALQSLCTALDLLAQ